MVASRFVSPHYAAVVLPRRDAKLALIVLIAPKAAAKRPLKKKLVPTPTFAMRRHKDSDGGLRIG